MNTLVSEQLTPTKTTMKSESPETFLDSKHVDHVIDAKPTSQTNVFPPLTCHTSLKNETDVSPHASTMNVHNTVILNPIYESRVPISTCARVSISVSPVKEFDEFKTESDVFKTELDTVNSPVPVSELQCSGIISPQTPLDTSEDRTDVSRADTKQASDLTSLSSSGSDMLPNYTSVPNATTTLNTTIETCIQQIIEHDPTNLTKPNLSESLNEKYENTVFQTSDELSRINSDIESHTETTPRYIDCGVDTKLRMDTTGMDNLSVTMDLILAHAYRGDNAQGPKYMTDIDFLTCLRNLKLTHNPKAVHTSKITIHVPNEVKLILAFGPKFNLPIAFNQKRGETLLQAIRNLNSFHMAVYEKRTITAMAREHMDSYKKDTLRVDDELHFFITHCHNCTVKFFNENPEYMIAVADKGNISMIITKTEYIMKVEQHLADTSTYEIVKSSSHNGYIRRNEFLIKQLADMNFIQRNAIPSIVANETRIPNMYGLIKIHKENMPIRPVVNTKSSPGYTLASIMAKLFSTARESHRYNVLNSNDVYERLSFITPDPDEYLATIDIKDMFTNISVEMAIASVRKRYHTNRINNAFPLNTIVDIIRFVASFATEIQFNDKIYKQIRGLKMGSSLSQILSDFVIEDIFDNVFIRIERPKLLIKYVDDCALLAHKNHITKIVVALNAVNEQLQFTTTMEDENGCITYLDIQIINDHSFNLKTRWLPKPMASGRFLNFHSSHPRSTIVNTAKCFVYNMFKLTHTSLNGDLVQIADQLLQLNNFPSILRQNIISEAIQKWKTNVGYNEMALNTILTIEADPFQLFSIDKYERAMYIALPFLNEVTPAVQNKIASINSSIKVIGKPIDTMKRVYDAHKNLRFDNNNKKRKTSEQ